jgi:hypothetical protein
VVPTPGVADACLGPRSPPGRCARRLGSAQTRNWPTNHNAATRDTCNLSKHQPRLGCKTKLLYTRPVGYTWLPGVFAILVGVEPHEVLQVLNGTGRRLPRRVVGPIGEPLLAIFGRTGPRRLVVFVRHDAGMDWQIVGARTMTDAEVTEYDRWEAEQ